MELEVVFVQGCGLCVAARRLAQRVAQEFGMSFKETDFLRHSEQLLELGVETTPVILLDSQVIYRGLPSPGELRRVVGSRL